MGNFLTFINDIWETFTGTLETLWNAIKNIPVMLNQIFSIITNLPIYYVAPFIVVITIALLLALKKAVSI